MAKEELQKFVTAQNIALEATFVPWSQSRNRGEKQPSLNWKINVTKGGRKILTGIDYMAGSAHAPSYKQGDNSVDRAEAVKYECENGKRARTLRSVGHIMGGQPILPSTIDVLYSLATDAGVLDHNDYESWAQEFGYEIDSRRGEKIYQACLQTALALRNGLGEDGLRALQDATQDY